MGRSVSANRPYLGVLVRKMEVQLEVLLFSTGRFVVCGFVPPGFVRVYVLHIVSVSLCDPNRYCIRESK